MAEVWHVIAAVIAIMLILVNVVAAVLVVVRVIQSRRIEMQTAANSQEVAAAIREIENTLHKICDGMTSETQFTRDNQEHLRGMISNVSVLVLDVEKHLKDELHDNREWIKLQANYRRDGTSVNISGGASGTQIGDGNNQK